ncbi:porin [uncultured Bradyrhizobium sp.]|uniref:porin n=1 Tax=uncultured Bradyrhizobium sp. TaxID=199684 RepID=UPI0035CC8AF1
MNVVIGMILRSAASLLAIADAQAADLPVTVKAVGYARICPADGAGFWYIPGTQLGCALVVEPGAAQGARYEFKDQDAVSLQLRAQRNF